MLKQFDVDHIAYAWYLIQFELMRLYFDGETYLQYIRPKLGQQIQLQETKAIGSESVTTLIAGQSDILDNAVESFIADIFKHTKQTLSPEKEPKSNPVSSDHAQIIESECKSDNEEAENEEKRKNEEQIKKTWKSRYIAQVSSFIKEKNVFAISTVHWQLSQTTQLLATKAILPYLPSQHTLPVRNVCYRECMRVYVSVCECL